MDRPDRRRADRQGRPYRPDRPPGEEPAAPAPHRRARRRRRAAGHLRRRVQCRRPDRSPGRAAGAPAGPAAGRQRHVRRPGHLARAQRPPAPARHPHNDPAAANPEPDESLVLPGTAQYGTVRVDAWRPVHPLIHAGRGWFKDNWHGELPVLRGTLLRVLVEHLPDGRPPRKTMRLWHAGPAPLSIDELWRAYLARFDEEHTFRFLKGALGLTAAKVRTPAQADRWVRLVMAAYAQLLIARPDTADLRRPWEKPPDPARPMTPGRVRRGFPNIRRQIGTPAHVAKPGRPGPGRPKGTVSGPAPRYPITKKSRNKKQQVKT